MNKQFDKHFDSVDLSRKWNTLMLSNFERWITLSFDRGQESMAFTNHDVCRHGLPNGGPAIIAATGYGNAQAG